MSSSMMETQDDDGDMHKNGDMHNNNNDDAPNSSDDTTTNKIGTSNTGSNSSRNGSSLLTRSRPFQLLIRKAFQICDKDNTGQIGKDEMYVGVLLIHLNLAKYAGPAACYPPSRKVCDQMFDAADCDGSGGISQPEFKSILTVLCAQILSRMLVYYAVLILLVPEISVYVVDRMKIPNGSYMELAAEQTISLSLFFLAIPIFWDWIDVRSEKAVDKLTTKASSGLVNDDDTRLRKKKEE